MLLAAGTIRSTASAARPDRKPATCQPVSDVDLMTAPPVEKSTAALTSSAIARRRSRWVIRNRCRTGVSRTERAEPLDQPADPFGDGVLLQRSVGHTEVAALVHAERGSGNDGDFEFTDETFGETERMLRRVHFHQAVESAVG